MCHAVAKEYRLQCCPRTTSNYMVFLEWIATWCCGLFTHAIFPAQQGMCSKHLTGLGSGHTMSIVREVEGHL